MTELRHDGRFGAGTFKGALELAAAVQRSGLEPAAVAGALGVPEGHMPRLLDGSMPLPSTQSHSYDVLVDLFDLVGSPLSLVTLYEWQRVDARIRAETPAPKLTVVDDR